MYKKIWENYTNKLKCSWNSRYNIINMMTVEGLL